MIGDLKRLHLFFHFVNIFLYFAFISKEIYRFQVKKYEE